MSEQEQWRGIAGFPGYEVSDRGRVLSHQRGTPHVLSGFTGHRGHRGALLYRDRKAHALWVHALVAGAFIGPRPAGMEVRHLDGDSSNNRADNIAYGTPSENRLDSVAHGTHRNARKTRCPKDHPYDAVNTYVDPRGKRQCRACRRVVRAVQLVLST